MERLYESVELFLEVKITVPFSREYIEGTDRSWSEFLTNLFEEEGFKESVFATEVRETATRLMDEVALRVERREQPVLVQLKTKEGLLIPRTIRDEV